MLVKDLERYLKQSGTVVVMNYGYLTVLIAMKLEKHVITEEMLVSTALVSMIMTHYIDGVAIGNTCMLGYYNRLLIIIVLMMVLYTQLCI